MAGCVGRRLLERFLGGELSLAESESVVNHVEVCAACQSLLDQLAHLESVPPLDAWLDDPERWDAEPADDFLDRLRRRSAGGVPAARRAAQVGSCPRWRRG